MQPVAYKGQCRVAVEQVEDPLAERGDGFAKIILKPGLAA